MLKIYREKNFEINLLENKISRQLKSRLLLSFLIAISFHLLFFFFFKIHLPKIYETEESKSFITIPLESFYNEDHSKLFEIDVQSNLIENFITPKYQEMILPNLGIDRINFMNPFVENKVEILWDEILNFPLHTLTKELSQPLSLPHPEYQIKVYGLLSNKIIKFPKSKIIQASYKEVYKKSFHYDVIVDNKMGKIIWFELKNKINDDLLTDKNNKLLKEILFDFDKRDDFITKGEIEILWTELIN